MRMLGAEMDQEARKSTINRQKNQKDPKVKQDFEETKDTREDARYVTRSLNHFLISTVNHVLIKTSVIKRVRLFLGCLGVLGI